MRRHADLLEVIDTLGSSGSFSGGLHGGQEERDEDANDGDHHQQLDECEGTGRVGAWPPWG
jgi:hypothetical protein